MTMLCEEYYQAYLSEFDRAVFEAFVRPHHPLRRALEVIDWDDFYPVLARYYCPDQGQPAINPVLMLKLEYLRYHHNLSDTQVIERARTDIAVRYFLQIGVCARLPDPSSLSIFRGRLGRGGFRRVFEEVVRMARKHDLVKDRLRIKDASHVIANIAVPSALALVAQMRDKLLAAAEPFDGVRTEGERVNVELLRERTTGQNQEQRLLARVTHLREILSWVDEVPPPEEAHDNHVETLSMDGAGFKGRVLRELGDPEGLNVNTFVPPPKEPASPTFTPEDFVEEAEQKCVRCPAGQRSTSRHRNQQDTGWMYQFKRSTCQNCPLLSRCMSHAPKGRSGRTVRKNDYEQEYRRARAKAASAEYAKVRTEHPKVERKLAEMLNRHSGRRARYHGQEKVLIQELMAAVATNVKRIMRLLRAPRAAWT